ncbi:hypothetical protein Glove_543g69 [Diversispora epigaea]|uniref:RRM domain-containing protein n=1 Tax=Diversispora epigaea TaxID=1348612 RepID=A0A397GDZ4_9GLOM|nr:hypothetical protein Glove_543g69 [Diversispora epigaea]
MNPYRHQCDNCNQMSYIIHSQEIIITEYKKIREVQEDLIKNQKHLISQLLDPNISPSSNKSNNSSSSNINISSSSNINFSSLSNINISSSPNIDISSLSSNTTMTRHTQPSNTIPSTIPNTIPIPNTMMITRSSNYLDNSTNNFTENNFTTNNNFTINNYISNNLNCESKHIKEIENYNEFFYFNTNSLSPLIQQEKEKEPYFDDFNINNNNNNNIMEENNSDDNKFWNSMLSLLNNTTENDSSKENNHNHNNHLSLLNNITENDSSKENNHNHNNHRNHYNHNNNYRNNDNDNGDESFKIQKDVYRVFISGLPNNTKWKDMFNFLDKFGVIKSLKIINKKNIAFAEFIEYKAYEYVLSQASFNFNGSNIKIVKMINKGKHYSTKYSKTLKKRSVNNNNYNYNNKGNNYNSSNNYNYYYNYNCINNYGNNYNYSSNNNNHDDYDEKRLANINEIERAIITMKKRLECGNDLNEERTKKSIKALENVVISMKKRLKKEEISNEEIANLDEIESFINNIKMMIKDIKDEKR